MTRPQDAPLVATLEHQYRELSALAARAERVRRDLVAPPDGWRGPARLAFEVAVGGLGACLDEAVQSVRAARSSTASTLGEVTARA